MHKETFPVNDDTISLDQSDSISQYTIVPNALIRDMTISPECRWLIIYLISNKPGWTIKSSQLWHHTKGFIGRNGIRKILNQAIEAGYMRRDAVLKPSPSGRGKMKGYVYIISSTPKFKKCLRQSNFRGTDNRGPEDWATKEVLSQELPSKKELSPTSLTGVEPKAAKAADRELPPKEKRKKETPLVSPKVREFATEMINILKRETPDYMPPKSLEPMLIEVDWLLNREQRDPEKLLAVFEWAVKDNFWHGKMYNENPAEYLRRKYTTIEKKMSEQKPEERPHLTNKKIVEKYFKHGKSYNQVYCEIDENEIGFHGGTTLKYLRFDQSKFWLELADILKYFDIPNPIKFTKQEQPCPA